jgi:methyl-accepting chemotaxis protein
VETGKSDIDASSATRDNACEFGKWLHAYRPTAKEKVPYEAVRAKHAEFHQVLGSIIRLAASGKKAEAKEGMGIGAPFTAASAALTLAMINWKRMVARNE